MRKIAPQRWLRRLLNPMSTGLTRRWHGQLRGVPSESSSSGRPTVTVFGVRSPGGWTAPPGLRPGWSWLPPQGAAPHLRAMPRWARAWYRLPLVDRYAYSWMWWRGGWLLPSAADGPAPPDAGVREPRSPVAPSHGDPARG